MLNHEEVLLVLAPCHRSGTNFLHNLLTLHPRCRGAGSIAEDFLLYHSDLLDGFVHAVGRSWARSWDPQRSHEAALRHELRTACVSFLRRQDPQAGRDFRYVVSKTPSAHNLTNLANWPGVRAVVIVRDGRDVVDSLCASFDTPFEDACRQWGRGAHDVLQARAKGAPFTIVHYEDLVRDQRSALTKLFEQLELPAEEYDFANADALPINGSSLVRETGGLHWQPQRKTPRFQPVGRWRKWSAWQHERFRRLVGDENERLGYPAEGPLRFATWLSVQSLDFLMQMTSSLKKIRRLADT